MKLKFYLFIFSISFVSISFHSHAQEYEVNVCPDESNFEYINETEKAPDSDSCCNGATKIGYVLGGNTEIINSIAVERLDGTNGPHRTKVLVDWKPNLTGTITVKVRYQKRYNDKWPCDCEWTSWHDLYTLTIERESPIPDGNLLGSNFVKSNNDDTHTPVTLRFDAVGPSTKEVRYWNGIEYVDRTHNLFWNKEVVFYAKDFGAYDLKTELRNKCGEWVEGPEKIIYKFPTCHDQKGDLKLDPGDYTIYDDGHKVNSGTTYSFTPPDITDFESHYDIIHDGGKDITLSGNTFTVHKKLGSYRIEAVLKEGRGEYCNPVDPLIIFTGGHDFTLTQKCPITLPNDLIDFGYEFELGEPALQHFAAKLTSEKGFVIKPGITLSKGCELILDYTPAPDPDDPDKGINYIQQISRNEYGEVISETRQYFDETGMPIQVQSKNLTGEVVLATETLHDAYGRPVIQTLPAPVSASSLEYVSECGEEVLVGDDLQFDYKESFVTSATGVKYNHTNFDLDYDEVNNITSSKEENPDPVRSDDEGTLAWYYSSKNGTSINPLLNEPMTPTTEYPYSRTLYHRDGSGAVKGAGGPGETHRAGSGHVATQNTAKVKNGDTYLTAYFRMAKNEKGVPITEVFEGNFFKVIAEDANGRTSETYQDLSGNTIMSLYYGDQLTPIIKSYQFYDVAGRLKANISPNGVEQYDETTNNYELIDKTTYTYNSKGWLVKTKEPDAGISEFVYRKDGSIRFSQNAQQEKDNTFSYTNYDRAGRPVASGEYLSNVGGIVFGSPEMKAEAILESRDPDGGLPEGTGTHRYQTFTGYDSPGEVPGDRIQRFVTGNVSWSKNDNTTTWYSYDDLGRVEWLVQDITGLGIKTIDYRYGPTGAVREVAYQKGDPTEDFYHYYTYDANGRLKEAFTSVTTLKYDIEGKLTNDPADLKLQASYEYYLHGPLKRVVIADGLQGIDYLYTINGALKSINHADPAKDPGGDGLSNDNDMRKDLFGMTLDYYPNDYRGAGYDAGSNLVVSAEPLYNGNIKGQSWHVPVDGHEPKAYQYEYDERYQLKNSIFGIVEKDEKDDDNKLIYNFTKHPKEAYKEAISLYDKNGNIEKLSRNGGIGNAIANYEYDYEPENPGAAFDNKLKQVTYDGSTFLEYEYNAIGQMTHQKTTEDEVSEMFVDYDVTGKVLGVYRDANKAVPLTKFTYDDRGFRLAKLTFDEKGENPFTTWYVRDVSGMVLSTYYQPAGFTKVDQIEVPIYGAGKIGLYKPMIESTYYELTDHLGNVRVVIGNKEKVTYMATMETELSENGGNPLYEEHFEEQFFDIKKRAPVGDDININHTPGIVTLENPEREFVVDPNQVIRLNNKVADHGGVDGAIMLKVNPGDKISAEVYAKFADFNKDNPDVIPAMLGHLASAFEKFMPTELALEIFKVVDTEAFALWPARQDIRNDQPMAFLNILFYDNNFTLKGVELDQISAGAEITETLSGKHERLEEEFEVTQGGWVYIYVSNESDQNMEVYFDDLKVTHEYGDIVAGGDFYPFGLAMGGREVTRESYRYGYQGQFSEKDGETGWNHFEARQYDARIGKWISPDPARQFNSPYVGMGNNPVNGVDPDGEWLFGLFGSTSAQRQRARSLRDTYGGEINNFIGKNISVTYSQEYFEGANGGLLTAENNYGWGVAIRNVQIQENGMIDYGSASVNATMDNYYSLMAMSQPASGELEFDALTQLSLGFAAVGVTARVVSLAGKFSFTRSLSLMPGRPLKFHMGLRYKPSNVMVRFERGYRSPIYKGLSNKSIITTHFNIAKPGVFNYHLHVNPVKWKYFY